MTGAIIPDDWDGVTYKCLRIQWPSSDLWEAILLGQVTIPTTAEYWDPDTGDAEDAASAVVTAYRQTIQNVFTEDCTDMENTEIVGSIKFWPMQSDPTGWHKCDGGVLSKTTFPDLFDVIGYDYGGSGDNYNVPNCAGRVPLHTLNIGGQKEVGWTGGEKDHQLIETEIPSHVHFQDNHYSADGGQVFGSAGFNVGKYSRQGSGTYYGARQVGATGGSAVHNNEQPYLVLNLIIKVFLDVP